MPSAPPRTQGLRRLGWLLSLIPAAALAGPPFITDDPEPVDYQHGEVYLASQTQHGPDGSSGTLPHVEVNYGLVPNLQVHVIAPDEFASSYSGPRQYGWGDIELGAKYRFVQESDSAPEIGVFPLVELPTGESSRGLGSGHTQVYLPVWLQKDFGRWVSYGGGGYWINPGAGNRNYWFVGWVLQKQVTKTLAIGAEIFHQTAQTEPGGSSSQVNVGFTWDLSDHYHVLASAGPSIQGPSGYQTYAAFQLTFGPKK
jgi:hypothetical protein